MIKFVEHSHRYINEEGKDLISVSSFAKQFEPKKNWKEIASKVAKKQGVPLQDILDLWDMKRDKGSQAGTLFHNEREQELIDNEFVFNKVALTKQCCQFIDGAKYSIPITNIENNTVYPELMIYNTEHMICGQSDKIIVQDNKIHVYDYKTDKSIDFKAYSSEWVKPEKLLPPVSHLDNCNGNMYALKMSMYMYMLWKANKGRFKPGDIILEWCPLERDEDGIPILRDGKPTAVRKEIIKLPYLRKEVEAMLNYKK